MESTGRIPSGIPGLDRVIEGGFVPNRSYMIRGEPGTGKTLLGLHFLTSGTHEERSLFINLGEAETDIRADARKMGFNLEDLEFLDLSPSTEFFTENQSYDVFSADSVESVPISEAIMEEVDELDPDRVFVDPLTQFRYLTADDYQFRKQVLSFLGYLKERECTTLFTSQNTAATPDDDLQFMSDGIVHLAYENDRRTIRVSKFRGSDFQGGRHAVEISDAGMTVYPELLPKDFGAKFSPEQLQSGIDGIDSLLHGGLERGTVTILTGPSGAGKTTLGVQFMREAATRGERSVLYMFEESESTLRHRSNAIGLPVDDLIEAGTLAVDEVNALTRSPQEFAAQVRSEVEQQDAKIVMIDGIDGYQLSLKGDEDDLVRNLNALGRYCKNMGVTAIFVSETSTVTGEFQATDQSVSYLADNIVFLRYLELEGELNKAVGVLKKRASDFERSLREFAITDDGIDVGEPLTGLQGILAGTPEVTASSAGVGRQSDIEGDGGG